MLNPALDFESCDCGYARAARGGRWGLSLSLRLARFAPLLGPPLAVLLVAAVAVHRACDQAGTVGRYLAAAAYTVPVSQRQPARTRYDRPLCAS